MAQFLGIPKVQYFDGNGDPLNAGKLFTYEVGTTTNKKSYPTIADAIADSNANANPVVLDRVFMPGLSASAALIPGSPELWRNSMLTTIC